ncbi:MAG TPA: hypothetical protein VIG38_11000 [Hyphomicrobium sp.]|jgi:hypothetical protein
MASWFIPPIVVPLGLAAIILAYAIYNLYAHPPARMQAVAIGVSVDTDLPGIRVPRGRA